MKIAIINDVHLEFGDLWLQNTENADLLIMAGDIMVAVDRKNYPRYRDFFKQACAEFKHVFYILGNHEHYHGYIHDTKEIIENEMDIKVYDNEYFDMPNGPRILGTTLWTDCNNRDQETMRTLKHGMNDYNIIKRKTEANTTRRLDPIDTVLLHEKAIQFIKDNVTDDCIVVTHHAPTHKSIHPRYVTDHMMNGGYKSDLGDLILDNPGINLWVHGHTHHAQDYMVGDYTRVVCNPRGYVGYEIDKNDVYKPLILES